MNKKIGLVIGSLRKESFSRKIGKALKELAPASLEIEEVDLSELTMYNQDLEDEDRTPKEWLDFRDVIKKLDAILFITPEYNRSVPPVLKNALDISSRPYGENSWDGKPAAVVSVSPGALGGFGANHHLRQSLVFLNLPAMQQPEAYIGNAAELFDDNNTLVNETTREFLKKFMDSFEVWVNNNLQR